MPSEAPTCCGKEMTPIGSGHAAGFAITIWRCRSCEASQTTSVRTDGQAFWVGAMGRAIREAELRAIADSYRGAPARDPDR